MSNVVNLTAYRQRREALARNADAALLSQRLAGLERAASQSTACAEALGLQGMSGADAERSAMRANALAAAAAFRLSLHHHARGVA